MKALTIRIKDLKVGQRLVDSNRREYEVTEVINSNQVELQCPSLALLKFDQKEINERVFISIY